MGDRRVAFPGRRVTVTMDMVLRTTRQDAEEQGQYGLYGKLGREDGLLMWPNLKDSHLDRSPRTPNGGFAGRDARRSGVREFREQRDGIQGILDASSKEVWRHLCCGRIAKYVPVQSGGEVESQRFGVTLRRAARQ